MTCEITYSFYGGNAEAFYCRDPEVILAGPADTGKTLALLTGLHLRALKYKNASLVIARKQLTDTYSTVLVTFRQKVLDEDEGGIRIYGGEKPQWFDYPNGSRIWVAGMDKSSKILSAEHDIIYVNQAEELSLVDWETLTTRTTGRAGHIPYNQTIGDCNPATPTHWIKTRSATGALTFFESTHRDNPELYDQETGSLTEAGHTRVGRLKALTGTRLLRLYHGLWAVPEGAIYEVFDEEKHVVTHFEPPLSWPRVVGIDPFGAHIAAVWLAYDPQAEMMNIYREYREPFGKTVAGHAASILQASYGETIFAWICGGPSERAWRTEFEAAGIPVIDPPIGDVWVGIDRVHRLLAEFGMVVHDNCAHLLSEIGDYRRKIDRDGVPTERIEHKERYHLLDALRYACAFLLEPREESRLVYMPTRIGPRY